MSGKIAVGQPTFRENNSLCKWDVNIRNCGEMGRVLMNY